MDPELLTDLELLREFKRRFTGGFVFAGLKPGPNAEDDPERQDLTFDYYMLSTAMGLVTRCQLILGRESMSNLEHIDDEDEEVEEEES